MSQKFSWSLFFLLPCFGCSTNMSVYRTLALDRSSFGVEGKIEVLKDKRLLDSDIKAFEEDPIEVGSNFESLPKFKEKQPKHAQLVFLNANNKVIQTIELEKAYASVNVLDLGLNKKFVLVEQNYSIGWGSYNGPIAQILEVTPNEMKWVKAQNPADHQSDDIMLMKSLKRDWKIVQTKTGKEILKVACNADSDSKEGFSTSYIRYQYTPNGWIKKMKVKPVEWWSENENDFPSLKNFPE